MTMGKVLTAAIPHATWLQGVLVPPVSNAACSALCRRAVGDGGCGPRAAGGLPQHIRPGPAAHQHQPLPAAGPAAPGGAADGAAADVPGACGPPARVFRPARGGYLLVPMLFCAAYNECQSLSKALQLTDLERVGRLHEYFAQLEVKREDHCHVATPRVLAERLMLIQLVFTIHLRSGPPAPVHCRRCTKNWSSWRRTWMCSWSCNSMILAHVWRRCLQIRQSPSAECRRSTRGWSSWRRA